MPNFRYKALARSGEVVEGSMTGPDQRSVVEQLRRAGNLPLRVDPAPAGGRSRGELWSRRRRIEKKDLVILTRQLATLLGAGVALDEALGIVAEVTEAGGATRLAGDLRERLARGIAFADALEAAGGVVPAWYVGMVRAGESSGALPTMLARLADFMDKAEATATELRSMLVYPAILMATTIGALVVFIMAVLPRFRAMFAQAGVQLPWATEALAQGADFLAEHGAWILLLLALAVLVARMAFGPERLRVVWRSVLERLPLASTLSRKIETARIARTLAALLGNGVPLLPSMGIVRSGVASPRLAAALDGVMASLREGKALATALTAATAFPPLAVRLLGIGERSGQLAPMLDRVADGLERDSTETIKRLMVALVPILTIVSGVVIALVMGSILTALLSINDLTR